MCESVLEKCIRQRRTINKFSSEAIDANILIPLIQAATMVPNHYLTQPWHYYFPTSQMIKKIVALNTKLVYHKRGENVALVKSKRWHSIPGWLLVTCKKSTDSQRFKEDYAACCCSIYALMLLLWEKNIGMKWTTGDVTRHDQLYEICKVDKSNQEVVGLIWYGYPIDIPRVQQRQSIDTIITRYS